MAEHTKIQWCDHTFNPWRGCTKVSTGCTHCYAEQLSRRNPKVLGVWGDDGTRVVASESAWREPLKWDREAARAGERGMVFCASLADVFEDRDDLHSPRSRLFRLIEATGNLDWLLLTKRPKVALEFDEWFRLTRNVWLGTSVEDQAAADDRIPELLKVPAAVRFLSVEPLLGPIDLGLWRVAHPKHRESWPTERVKDFWVIVGGESGPKARPCNLAWMRSVRDQCEEAGVPCFVKQMGSRPVGFHPELCPRCGHYDLGPVDGGPSLCNRCDAVCDRARDSHGGDIDEFPPDLRVREFPAAAVPA